ncbi:MAG: JDVT-CTERM system glutamic-type intramembrane protease MrtJ [Noviherbaspirillum sp.]
MTGSLADEPGLRCEPSFIRDRLFLLALAAGPLTTMAMSWLLPGGSRDVSLLTALYVILWQPAVEELLFRGLIQGQMGKAPGGRAGIAGLSLANLVTSLLFALAHLLHHSAWWAAAVIVPSLVFGFFRERHRQIYSAFILHATYNGCYLLVG